MSVFFPDRNASSPVIISNQHDGEKSKDHPNKAPSLKRELFASPLQEKIFTLIINSLIEAKNVSYQLFRDHLPQIAEFTHPKNKTNVVFEGIRIISRNFNEEFAPRILWAHFDDYKHINSDQVIGKVNKTKCGTTHDVLIASIFGNDSSLRASDLSKYTDYPTQVNLIEVIQSIAEENLLKTARSDTFYAYSFSLFSKDSFPGHAFVVLQNKDEAGALCYHFFQSYICHYTLHGYLKAGIKPLNHLEFLSFLKNLELCITSPTWTQLEDTFFRKYFGDPKISIGQSNPCSQARFAIRCGERNLQDFVHLQDKFHDWKKHFKHPDFKKTHKGSRDPLIIRNRKNHLPMTPIFAIPLPRILAIEGHKARAGINMWIINNALEEQIRVGSSLLEPFSISELSYFYDLYGNFIYDWLKMCSKVTPSSFFCAELKEAFDNFDFTEDFKKESEIIAEHLLKKLFKDDKGYFYYDQHSLSTVIETIARNYAEEDIFESSDKEFEQKLSKITNQQNLHQTYLSKKEILGLWFYQMLLRFLDPDEIIEKKKIRLGTEILFPFPQGQGISALENLTFTLMPHLLATLTNEDPFDSSSSYSNYDSKLLPNIQDGLNSYVLKTCSTNSTPNDTNQLESKTALLLENAHKAIKIYPYLKSKFLYSILAPMSMLSTFDSSTILTLEQKNKLNHYSNTVLDLYFRYFDEVSGETLKRNPSKKESHSNSVYPSRSTGQNTLKFLEMIHDTPDLFSRFIDFQMQCMQDLLKPCRRHEDLKRDKHWFLPHVAINTPFSEAMPHQSYSYLKTALQHTRNYREFLLMAQYFNTQNFTKLSKKYSNDDTLKLIEKLIKEIIHEKIHPSLLDELHESTRFITNRIDSRNFIKATGIPAVMDDFFACGAGT